ncbi:MAG TPA: ornithine carbamoyltransferase [bacterium]|nr:ornithine carbamoyltransferase [bacterium]
MKHCVTLDDFSGEELLHIVQLALRLKREPQSFEGILKGRWLLMLFQKTSTRTRMSFEIGMGRLGGRAIVMDWDSSNFSISPIEYEARYASTHTDLIMARLKLHRDTRSLADSSQVPVINGCDDKYHPCQGLADLLTVYEQNGSFAGQAVAYVGIHNNVANSLTCGLSKVGARTILVTPETNAAAEDPELMERALATGLVERTLNLRDAAERATFVYTDTWVDMEFFEEPSYQAEKERRIAQMGPYQLNRENLAGSDAYIMHDMPIHPGYEITKEVVASPRSVIFRQAENRMYAQQALMLYLLGISEG